MAIDTRDRLVQSSAALFQRQGLAGTGIKQILGEADAPFSSLYHHFPGGKDELAAETIRVAGAGFQQIVEAVWDAEADVVASVRAVFRGAGEVLEDSDYADACPIAVVALEVASTNEPLRLATAEVFDAWIDSASKRFRAAGIPRGEARRLAHLIVMLIEGSFLLCRSSRTLEPMRAAGKTAVAEVQRALAASSKRSRAPRSRRS